MSDIDNLTECFNRSLNVSENNSPETSRSNSPKMSKPNEIPSGVANVEILKMYLDAIPLYDGKSNSLTSFIAGCDFVFETYGRSDDRILNNFLIRVIQMKFVGDAQILVGSRLELKSWDSIKAALIDCFGDKRSLECLEQDLFIAQPLKNEKPLDFGKRLQVLRSVLAQRINSFPNEEMNSDSKLIHIRQYEQVCLRTFIRGLPSYLQSIVRLKNPDNLEAGMKYVVEEENFRYSQNLFKSEESAAMSMSQTNNPIPRPNKQFLNRNRIQSYQQFNNQLQNPHHSSNYPHAFGPSQRHQQNFAARQTFPNYVRNQFPQGPINIQTRPIPRHYPTSRQVFGPPKNVFKPTGQIPRNQPTPMSITSRNITPQQGRYSGPTYTHNYNQFIPTGPKNFISEELYQIDGLTPDINNSTETEFSHCYNDYQGHETYAENCTELDEYQNSNEYLDITEENFQLPGLSNNQT